MNQPVFIGVLFLVLSILMIIFMGLQIYVGRQLKAAGIQSQGTGRVRNRWMLTFANGWQNAKTLGITDVMAVWSLVLFLACILGTWLTVLVINNAPQ